MLRLKTIDRYIIRKFLGTFFYAILLLAVIIIIFDISEKIDDFIEKEAPLKAIIFDYYANFLPYFVNMFSSLFTFIAVIFFTSRMASNTEIIAILNGGVSFKRFLWPYLLSGLFLTLLSFVLMNYIIPYTNRSLRDFEKKYIKNQFVNRETNIHMQIKKGTYIYVENFNTLENLGYRFSIEQFDSSGLKSKMNAETIKWDSLSNKWQLNNYLIRVIHDQGEDISKGSKIDSAMAFTPLDFATDIEDAKIMTFNQLNNFIKREKLRGTNIAGQFELEKHKRITFPFANLVLTFIGVALSSRKVRGGIGMHLGMGIAIAFTFILLLQVTSVFAIFGNVPPAIALWIPNILYSILALYLLKIAPK